MNKNASTRVAVMGGARTPFVKAGTIFKKYSALELGVHSVDGLLEKQKLDADSVDELIYGIVVVTPKVSHLAREVNFSSRLPSKVRALTVTDNCITGLSAVAIVHDSIVGGRTQVGIAGGVESMSNPALLFGKAASRIFLDAAAARSTGERLKHF